MKKVIIVMLSVLLLVAGCAAGTDVPLTVDAPDPASEKKPELVDETEPASCSNISIAVRRNAETVSERSVTDEEEVQAVQEIIFDYMVKSAAWEGIEVSELEDCITLSFNWTPDSERQVYYQYDTEGRHVLQAGEAGMYTVMSSEAYNKLLQLAGLPADNRISVDEAITMMIGRFGEKDADTGNLFSFGYVETLSIDGKEYYRFRISWLVDNDHLSYVTDYLVATDGSEMREYSPED